MAIESISPLYIEKMTFREVGAAIKEQSALILPVGSIEPCTESGTLGVASLTCFAMANALSKKKNILLAPMINYGYSVAFKSFPGCAAISRRTLIAVLRGIVSSWKCQGIKRFIILDGTSGSADALNEALKGLFAKDKSSSCRVLDWNRKDVDDFIARQNNGTEFGRSQFGLLSMASYLDPDYVRKPLSDGALSLKIDFKDFLRWRKTGQDPEKFRKLFPDARTSSIAYAFSPEFGKELFFHIIGIFENEIALELKI